MSYQITLTAAPSGAAPVPAIRSLHDALCCPWSAHHSILKMEAADSSETLLLLFSILSDDRSKASSKTIPPHSAIQSLLFQMTVSSPVLKVIQ